MDPRPSFRRPLSSRCTLRPVRGLPVRAFTLIELMIVVAIIGVLASIAIPSFMKYIRRSKTTEAIMNLRKVFDASVSYFESEHTNMTGAILNKQFPTTQAATPAVGSCCASTGQKCAPVPTLWSVATWQSLNFSIDDPYYYSYSFASSGVDATSTFDALANGDLNCDTKYSTFARHGSIDAQNNVSGGSGIYTKNDLD